MPSMGRYCKAYLASRFRDFPGWQENIGALREPEPGDAAAASEPRTELKPDDILYLQENYAVTDGIFLDEHVVFVSDAPEWKEFCAKVLEFAVPDDVVHTE